MSTEAEREAKRALGFPLIDAARKEENKREKNKPPAPYKNQEPTKTVKPPTKDILPEDETDEPDNWIDFTF